MYLYFTGSGIIFQVSISQRVDWSAASHTHAKTSNFLFHCIALYVFRQLTLIDESNFTCFPFHATKACHDQRGEWTMFYLVTKNAWDGTFQEIKIRFLCLQVFLNFLCDNLANRGRFSQRSPAGNDMFKVKNRSSTTRCEICSELTIKT